MKTEPTTTNPIRNHGHACSDFTPRRDELGYRVHSSAWPIPYRLTETAPHYEDMDQRAREAGL